MKNSKTSSYFLCFFLLLSPSTCPLLSKEVSQMKWQIINDFSRSQKVHLTGLYGVSPRTTFVLELCIVENGCKLAFPGRTVSFIDHWDVLQIAGPHPVPRQRAQITLPDSSLSLPALSGARWVNIRSQSWIIWGQKNILPTFECVSFNGKGGDSQIINMYYIDI